MEKKQVAYRKRRGLFYDKSCGGTRVKLELDFEKEIEMMGTVAPSKQLKRPPSRRYLRRKLR